jgi:hypothetical protein
METARSGCSCEFEKLNNLMGRCQRAGTSKNKKVAENFPPASVLVCEISLKKYYSSLKLVRSKIIFVLSCHNITELFKNSVRKIFNRKICCFPHPFSSQQHRNAPLSDISPLKERKMNKDDLI